MIDTSKIEKMFQPFRTATIVLPEAKTIYGDGHTGHKYVTPSGENDEKVVIKSFMNFIDLYFSHLEQLHSLWLKLNPYLKMDMLDTNM